MKLIDVGDGDERLSIVAEKICAIKFVENVITVYLVGGHSFDICIGDGEEMMCFYAEICEQIEEIDGRTENA